MKKKIALILAFVFVLAAMPAAYNYAEAKAPARKTATTKKKTTTKKTSTAKKSYATDTPFKGYWEKGSDAAGYCTIDIDLYSPKYDSEYDTMSYGTISYVSLRRLDEHIITNVVSIDGNTAIIESECPHCCQTQRGQLTYNPSTGRMTYKQIAGGDYCFTKEMLNLPRAKKP